MPLEDDLRGYAAALASEAAAAMVEELREAAPVRTGFLLSTIEDAPEPDEGPTHVSVTLRALAPYADEVDEEGRSAGWWSGVVEDWEGHLQRAEDAR